MNGEVHRKENEVIEYPENYKEMKEKYLEREEEKLKLILARRKAETELELEGIATKAITTRANRATSEHKPLKDRTILREAKSEDIQELKKKLNEEINAISRRILKELPHDAPSLEGKILGGLKGRVSQPSSPDWSKVGDE